MSSRAGEAPLEGVSLRMLVIDDDTAWCTVLGHMMRSIGHALDVASNVEDAKRMIVEAEQLQRPYVIAIIDMNFKIGSFDLVQGEELIEYIKQHHPQTACVVASGEKVAPDDVLDLRDNKDLDYYLQKDRISIEKLRKAVSRSLQRIERATAVPAQQAMPSEPPTPVSIVPIAAAAESAQSQTIQVQIDFQQQAEATQLIWRAPLIGREQTSFVPPYRPYELPLVIRSLDVLQYPDYQELPQLCEPYFQFDPEAQNTLRQLGLWAADRVASDAAQTVGKALYRALGSEGQRVLRAIRNASIAQGQTTNYVLRFPAEAITLAALPWELLWDDEKNQAVLIRGHTIDSCERYIDLDLALPPPPPQGQRLHVLALTPSYGMSEQARQAERTARRTVWDRLEANGTLVVGEVSPLTMPRLNDYLLNTPQRPDIVHYFGHGTYRDGRGYLIFDDGRGGRDMVSAERLAATLGDVRLVVLHACQSAMAHEERGLLTGIAPALSIVASAVVAMQLTVRNDAATRFAQVFYEQLLHRGHSLQEAVARGRQVLFSETTDGASWYVPTLYIRARTAQPLYFRRL